MGTRGDIAPFVAIAAALVARGHDVTILSNENWRALVQQTGAGFAAIAPEDPTQSGRDNFAFFVKNVLPSFRESFEIIEAIRAAGSRVVLAYKLGMFGAQCAAEKFGLTNVKIALQPSAVRSAIRPAWPLTRLVQGRWSPLTRQLIPVLYYARELYGRYRRHTNRFRASLGLAPDRAGVIRRVEDMTIMMCPQWFAMPQTDWPQHCRFAGFPFLTGGELPQSIMQFVMREGAPLVFTPGTGVSDTQRFFATAERVCDTLNLPAIFLGSGAACSAGNQRVLCIPFADLGALLPRSRLLVHHGGIGTTAQAIRSGIPQVILPGQFDQPDNAMRVATLRLGGAAFGAAPSHDDWVDLIWRADNDVSLRRRLAIASADVRATDAAANAATLIETLQSERAEASQLEIVPARRMTGAQLPAHEPA